MSKGFCGLHGLSTKKSSMTKMKARYCQFYVKFNSAKALLTGQGMVQWTTGKWDTSTKWDTSQKQL